MATGRFPDTSLEVPRAWSLYDTGGGQSPGSEARQGRIGSPAAPRTADSLGSDGEAINEEKECTGGPNSAVYDNMNLELPYPRTTWNLWSRGKYDTVVGF